MIFSKHTWSFCTKLKKKYFKKRSFAHCSFPLFSKERLSDRSFCCSLQKSKWAIALFSLFSKERQKERSLFRSFKKNDEKSNRSFTLSKRAKEQKWGIWKIANFLLKKRAIAHFQNEQMANPGCRVGQSLIRLFAHHSFLLLSKEQLSNRLLICSFKKSD